MKRRVAVLSAALFALTAAPSFAQEMVTFGAKVGINFANVSLDPEDDDCCEHSDPHTGSFQCRDVHRLPISQSRLRKRRPPTGRPVR